jgi:hypothetical protein
MDEMKRFIESLDLPRLLENIESKDTPVADKALVLAGTNYKIILKLTELVQDLGERLEALEFENFTTRGNA